MSKLTFEFIANASGIFTGSNGTRLLCDPWIVDGVFEGSWCHFPKLQTTLNDLKKVNAIYVSHIHPDHFDERYFDFPKETPLIILDHGPNFLARKLEMLGFSNLVRVKSGETATFKEFRLTLYAPFAKHNFFEAEIGNLIDSALIVECGGVTAFNANDNTPTPESCEMLKEKFGTFDLAMLNYNAAGPYPSCFENLTEDEKRSEHARIMDRNFEYMYQLLKVLEPRYCLPFAGAYVLGGDLHPKNEYLGTTTWDVCADYLRQRDLPQTGIICMRENDIFDIQSGLPNRPYVPLDENEMARYIREQLSRIEYPYQMDDTPDPKLLAKDIHVASLRMQERMQRFGINPKFKINLTANEAEYEIYPGIEGAGTISCQMDERLLRRILDRNAHWNNAEIGAHISFYREPNTYDPDLHTGLQFFHL